LQANKIDPVAAKQQTNKTAEAGVDRGDERPRARRHMLAILALDESPREAIFTIRYLLATLSAHPRLSQGIGRATEPPLLRLGVRSRSVTGVMRPCSARVIRLAYALPFRDGDTSGSPAVRN
jgi:hypothetical protein